MPPRKEGKAVKTPKIAKSVTTTTTTTVPRAAAAPRRGQKRKASVTLQPAAKRQRVLKSSRPDSGRPLGVSSRPISRSLESKLFMGGRNASSRRQRVVGREYITTLKVNSDVALAAGGILYSKANKCNPLNTRLERFASLFERWKANRYTYHFIPSAATTREGTLIFASEPDPLALYSDTSTNVAKLMALSGSSVKQVWQEAVTPMPASRDYTSLWTNDISPLAADANDRLCFAGTHIVAIAALGTGTSAITTGSELGILELEYDIEFYDPRLNFDTTTDKSEWWQMTFPQFKQIVALSANNAMISGFMRYYMEKLPALGAWATAYQGLMSIVKIYQDFVNWSNPSSEQEEDVPDAAPPRLLRVGKGRSNPYSSEAVGFPPGEYNFQVGFFHNDLFNITLGTASRIDENVTNGAGFPVGVQYAGSGAGTGFTQSEAPDGKLYSSSKWLDMNYVVSGVQRGYVDTVWDFTGSSVPDNTQVFFRMQPHDEINVVPTSLTSIYDLNRKRRPVLSVVPPIESKNAPLYSPGDAKSATGITAPTARVDASALKLGGERPFVATTTTVSLPTVIAAVDPDDDIVSVVPMTPPIRRVLKR